MQGIYVYDRRPKSKKAVKEAVAADPSTVRLEATSVFGNEYDGPLNQAPNGTYTFVGPDPYSARNYYGSIVVRDGKITVK